MRTYIYGFILLTVSFLGIRDLVTEDPAPSHKELIGYASSMEDSPLAVDNSDYPQSDGQAQVQTEDSCKLFALGSVYPYFYGVVKFYIARPRFNDPLGGYLYISNTFKCCLKSSLFRNRYYEQGRNHVQT